MVKDSSKMTLIGYALLHGAVSDIRGEVIKAVGSMSEQQLMNVFIAFKNVTCNNVPQRMLF